MKKIVYVLVGILVILAAGYFGYVQFDSLNDSSQEVERATAIQEAEEKLDWEAAFPDVVPEYPGGKIKELDVVDSQYSMFDDEVAVLIEETDRKELDSYIAMLLEKGWEKGYQRPEGNSYNLLLSLEEKGISISLNEDGILMLSSYTQPE